MIEWQLDRPRSQFDDPSEYQAIDNSWNQIPENEISNFNLNFGKLKKTHAMEEMLERTSLLFFPADRFEPPDWLNLDNLSADLSLSVPKRFRGKTQRRIISKNRLKPTLEWLNLVIFEVVPENRTVV